MKTTVTVISEDATPKYREYYKYSEEVLLVETTPLLIAIKRLCSPKVKVGLALEEERIIGAQLYFFNRAKKETEKVVIPLGEREVHWILAVDSFVLYPKLHEGKNIEEMFPFTFDIDIPEQFL